MLNHPHFSATLEESTSVFDYQNVLLVTGLITVTRTIIKISKLNNKIKTKNRRR